MIYLLRSPAWEKEAGYFQILKIGWSDDSKPWLKSKVKSRKRSYKSHNPTSEMLVEVPGMGLEVEEALHDLFSIHRYKDTDEWYYFVPEIINFFSSPDLLQNLEELRKRGIQLREEKEWKRDNPIYNYYLEDFLEEIGEISFPVITSRRGDWWEKIKPHLTSIQFLQLENIIGLYESIKENRNKDILEVFYKLVRAKTEDKRVELLNDALEWMEEEDFAFLSFHLPNHKTRNYYLEHGNG